jgi:hypothetical protein
LKTIYAKYNRDRFPQFQIETTIIQEGPSRYVVKRALSESAHSHIEAIYQGYRWMSEDVLDNRIKQPRIIEKKNHQIVFEFIEGQSLEKLLYETFQRGDRLQYLYETDRYHNLLFNAFKIVGNFHLVPENELFFREVDLGFIQNEGAFSPHAFLDLVMDNILLTADGSYYCIDPEWVVSATFPLTFVFFRSLSAFYAKFGEFNVENFSPFADLMNRYGISASECDQYAKIEENFQRHIVRNRLYYRGQYLKKRVLLSALIPYLNRTNQQLIQEYEEKFQQLLSDRNALATEVCHADADRKRLIEQAKIRDDLITRLHNSYSMKIGKTVLFPVKYIRDLLSRT